MSRTDRNRKVLDEEIELHHEDRRVQRLRGFAHRISCRYLSSQRTMWLKEARKVHALPEDLERVYREYSSALDFQREYDRQMSS